MFNKNFYPSPAKVIELLSDGIRFSYGDRVLEPSAGKGDIADYLKAHKKFKRIDCIESEPELAMILSEKGYPLIAYDFLSFRTYTEYDCIIMNPPFDKGDQHLIHAIELAEKQIYKECSISCVLNAETLKNPYSTVRQHLTQLLQKYGAEITYHENLFSEAERSTNVETAIIKLTVASVKQSVGNVYADILDSIQSNSGSSNLETALSTVLNQQEIVARVKDIKTLVKQYEFHISLLRKKFESMKSLDYLESLLYSARKESLSTPKNFKECGLNESIESLRSDYWEEILSTKEFSSKLTDHGRKQLMAQLDAAKSMEVTVENIEMLLMAVMQNSNQIILDSCVHMFEELTKYHQTSYSSNIHYYNGWKTNNAFKINKKIIVPIRESYGTWGEDIEYEQLYYSFKWYFNDILKMFKFLKPDLSTEFSRVGTMEFECEIFKFKVFKKGTVHLWFKDLELLEQFNVLCGQQYNWIPADDEIKQHAEAKEFMAENFSEYLKIKRLE